MKKVLVLAAMALMTATASALTLTWDSEKSSFVNTNGDKVGFYGDFSVSFTFATTTTGALGLTGNSVNTIFKLVSASGSGTLEWTTQRSPANDGNTYQTQILFSNSTDSQVTYYTGGHYSDVRADANEAGVTKRDNVWTITMKDSDADGKYNTLNATALFAKNNDSANEDLGIASGSHSTVFSSDNVIDWNELVLADGIELKSLTVTVDDDKSVGVPEPTALALLALGVAGVALRRKVK